MTWVLDKIFGGGNKREVTKLQSIVDKINSYESEIEKLSDKELSDKTIEFREVLNPPAGEGKTLDDILPEAFAVVREAAKREIGQRHFDVQLIGGMVLHHGKISEMKTGEGKTLVATLALYLNAIEGKGAHLVTVNDYLSKYQGEWMGRVYDRLGLKTGIIQNQGVSFVFERGWGKKNQTEEQAAAGEVLDDNLRPSTRKESYDADITYGTNNEYGFDYLRDNMAQSAEQLVQRAEGLNFAIVDEVDSILIDEARTPLIISSPAEESADLYAKFATIVPNLKRDVDFEIDEKLRAVSLNDAGIEKLEKILGIANVFQPETISLVHHLEEALKAHALFTKDKDYVVKDGEVIIVDEFTGRMMPGRRYSEGLHQAIEAKEGVAINRESDTLATISFQNFFRLYDKLAGMTGTAATEAEEFNKIYKLEVVEIPTNQPMIREDLHDQIYKNEDAKFNAIVAKVKELNEKKQPVLIGTISIAKSEMLSKLLKRSGVKHEVLNAKAHEREAKIIAQAGSEAAVTVATNMAGRGVDILLGGNPPKEDEAENVKSAGGLFVIGTERHESRRIDNQLRGRAGRQGDQGGSQFFISMDDDLMRIFGGDRLKGMMDRLGLADDQPIEHSMISKSIESAQRRVEGNNFDTRKHLVEYDDVMNKQREVFYRRRRRILSLDPLEDNSLHEQLTAQMSEEESGAYGKNIANADIKAVRDIERRVSLSIMDQSWIEHLNTMDQLRDSIGLRGYAQVDPLVAYKEESLRLFEGLMRAIDDEILGMLTKINFGQMQTQAPRPKANPLEYQGADLENSSEAIQAAINDETTDVVEIEEAIVSETDTKFASSKTSRDVITTVRTVGERMQQASAQTNSIQGEKIGRNDPCSCGAKKADGMPKKYKHCCGR